MLDASLQAACQRRRFLLASNQVDPSGDLIPGYMQSMGTGTSNKLQLLAQGGVQASSTRQRTRHLHPVRAQPAHRGGGEGPSPCHDPGCSRPTGKAKRFLRCSHCWKKEWNKDSSGSNQQKARGKNKEEELPRGTVPNGSTASWKSRHEAADEIGTISYQDGASLLTEPP